MFNYSLTSLRKLGDADPKYGQTYWGYASETDMGIMFNSMEDLELTEDGPLNITAETKEIKMGKKGEYIRLKKVKLAEQPSLPIKQATEPVRAPQSNSDALARIEARLVSIEKMVSQLLSNDDELEAAGKSIQQALNDGDDMPDNFLT